MRNLLKYGAAAAAVCGLLAAMPLAASADTESAAESEALYSEDGLYRYGLDESGNVKIFDFTASDTFEGELVIPAQIDGKDVVYLGNGAFSEADGITSVTIPATVESLGTSVFMGCSALEAFAMDGEGGSLVVDEAGVLFSNGGTMLECYPPAKADTSYVIPDTVDEIAPSAFMFCETLRDVTIPESVLYIDAWAFSYTMMEKIVLPDSLIQIDDYAFAYSTSLREVEFGEGLLYIYGAAFAECRALEEIDLPEKLETVEQYAFCGTSLKSVVIPDSVTQIGYCAFGYDSNLNAISDFTVYGTPYSMAQTYCTASDDENDYQNNFMFVAIDENGDPLPTDVTETAAESPESEDDTSEAPAAEESSNALTFALVGGGVLLAVLAVVLVVLLMKKPKTKKQDDAQ